MSKKLIVEINITLNFLFRFHEQFPEDQKSLFKKALANMESSVSKTNLSCGLYQQKYGDMPTLKSLNNEAR